MNKKIVFKLILLMFTGMLLFSCNLQSPTPPRVPAVEYARRIQAETNSYKQIVVQPETAIPLIKTASNEGMRAKLRLVGEGEGGLSNVVEDTPILEDAPLSALKEQSPPQTEDNTSPSYITHESSLQDKRDYNGPLSLGDPGISASLWKESRGSNDLFRDYRAWQPMDLVTIVVSESSEGKKEADTEVKQESTISAAIENLLGLEDTSTRKNTQVDLDSLISATSSHDYKGEGETTRKGSLKGKISAMVVEVLVSGVLRIEGEKIISVNNEDEVMVISGLVRPEDINSQNEIDSSKVAQVRIDYFGKGTVGDAQIGGWLGRIMRRLWPF